MLNFPVRYLYSMYLLARVVLWSLGKHSGVLFPQTQSHQPSSWWSSTSNTQCNPTNVSLAARYVAFGFFPEHNALSQVPFQVFGMFLQLLEQRAFCMQK